MKPQLIYYLRYRLLHQPHLGHSNTPGCCQTQYKENNHDALPDPLPSNAQWQGSIGEDPFRKCSVLMRPHTPYRCTYTVEITAFRIYFYFTRGNHLTFFEKVSSG